jgi:hypothetical protein
MAKDKAALASPTKGQRGSAKYPGKITVALQIADSMELLAGPKTKHFNAKVSPRLFAAAAKRIGTASPVAVINAALAALATEDELGPWLAARWGSLSGIEQDVLAQIDI